MQPVTLNPIGIVHNDVTDPIDENWSKVISDIQVRPELADGLKGLDTWSHIIIIYVLHQAQFNPTTHLVRRPRDLDEMPELGIFAQRARHRPNLIGISAVKLLDVHDLGVRVRGLDAINGTPVLDIKPYAPIYDGVLNPLVPAWFVQLMQGYF